MDVRGWDRDKYKEAKSRRRQKHSRIPIGSKIYKNIFVHKNREDGKNEDLEK
jgi:hypothetical protein